MKTRITLCAEDGMMLTDGEHFGLVVHLEAGADPGAWREITLAEYRERLAEQMAESAAVRGADAGKAVEV